MDWKKEKEIAKEVEIQKAMFRGIEASVQRATTAITSIRNLTQFQRQHNILGKELGHSASRITRRYSGFDAVDTN